MNEVFHEELLINMDRWKYYDDNSDITLEEEMLYNQALSTVKIIEENVRLRKENKRLMNKVAENEEWANQHLHNNIKFAGNLLGSLLQKAEIK